MAVCLLMCTLTEGRLEAVCDSWMPEKYFDTLRITCEKLAMS